MLGVSHSRWNQSEDAVLHQTILSRSNSNKIREADVRLAASKLDRTAAACRERARTLQRKALAQKPEVQVVKATSPIQPVQSVESELANKVEGAEMSLSFEITGIQINAGKLIISFKNEL